MYSRTIRGDCQQGMGSIEEHCTDFVLPFPFPVHSPMMSVAMELSGASRHLHPAAMTAHDYMCGTWYATSPRRWYIQLSTKRLVLTLQ